MICNILFSLNYRISWDRWILMILIGFTIGLLASLLKQVLTALANVKWDKTKELARVSDNKE